MHRNRVPFDLAVTWRLISVRGVEGAAIAFAIHAGIDAVGHLVIAESILPEVAVDVARFAWMLLPAEDRA